MIEIIPAIDVIDGKCVRLTYGDFSRKTVYADDPLEVAKRFEGLGIRRLHMVDLDGAKTGKPQNLPVLNAVAENTNLTIDFGGGIKTDDDVNAVFDTGAAIVNVGSIAVKDPKLFLDWIERYGSDRILLGADCKDGKVAINGWQADTEISIFDLLKDYSENGVRSAFVTDIGRDGAMAGPSVDLYKEILATVPKLILIASGGVGEIADVECLDAVGCSAVIVGKAIYEGRISDEELKRYAR
ncbi:MAG TPA: 1-(5-phosphoribosyl)-5-[(5-phosphoribosylamino)methylideneamino]imidazole-4-carboxamide isomerase [Pyrinomonadaceae bacterium]|nr:1-(5-phosphoribosyl)-5-[(5-phosphoribosylamino)methylideneamino]imidazole-4-carboxamide isomerase [Pyrinomonadaceae bacterium]